MGRNRYPDTRPEVFGWYIPRTRTGGCGFTSVKEADAAAREHAMGDEYQIGIGEAPFGGYAESLLYTKKEP